jgi:hypothetical protein
MGSMAVAPTLANEEQRSLYAERAREGNGLDDRAILGPILLLKVRFVPEDYARKLAAELAALNLDRQLDGRSGISRTSDAHRVGR